MATNRMTKKEMEIQESRFYKKCLLKAMELENKSRRDVGGLIGRIFAFWIPFAVGIVFVLTQRTHEFLFPVGIIGCGWGVLGIIVNLIWGRANKREHERTVELINELIRVTDRKIELLEAGKAIKPADTAVHLSFVGLSTPKCKNCAYLKEERVGYGEDAQTSFYCTKIKRNVNTSNACDGYQERLVAELYSKVAKLVEDAAIGFR